MGALPTVVERLLSLELILDNFPIWPTEIEKKHPRHWVFPDGPPSKYYPGPTMLNFRDLTRTGVFIEVWWYTGWNTLINSSTIYCEQVLTMYLFLEIFLLHFWVQLFFLFFYFFFKYVGTN